jgi:hypothetical protein
LFVGDKLLISKVAFFQGYMKENIYWGRERGKGRGEGGGGRGEGKGRGRGERRVPRSSTSPLP